MDHAPNGCNELACQILFREFDRAVWEIHQRVEYRQQLIQAELLLISIIPTIFLGLASMINEARSLFSIDLLDLFSYIMPAISTVFSLFLLEIASHNNMRYVAARYIPQVVRPRLELIVGYRNLMGWESFLRNPGKLDELDRLRTKRSHSNFFNSNYPSPLRQIRIFTLLLVSPFMTGVANLYLASSHLQRTWLSC